MSSNNEPPTTCSASRAQRKAERGASDSDESMDADRSYEEDNDAVLSDASSEEIMQLPSVSTAATTAGPHSIATAPNGRPISNTADQSAVTGPSAATVLTGVPSSTIIGPSAAVGLPVAAQPPVANAIGRRLPPSSASLSVTPPSAMSAAQISAELQLWRDRETLAKLRLSVPQLELDVASTTAVVNFPHRRRSKPSDIDSLVGLFTGDDDYAIEKWLQDFEAVMVSYNADANDRYRMGRHRLGDRPVTHG